MPLLIQANFAFVDMINYQISICAQNLLSRNIIDWLNYDFLCSFAVMDVVILALTPTYTKASKDKVITFNTYWPNST